MTISFSSSAALLQWSEGLRYLLYMNIFITFFHFCSTLFEWGLGLLVYSSFCVEVVPVQQTAGLQRSCKELYFIMYISITHIL
jgi:hypothetical protein